MYLIRRIYKTKPGEARKAAELIKKQGERYRDAGQRRQGSVSYKRATRPGEQDAAAACWPSIITDATKSIAAVQSS